MAVIVRGRVPGEEFALSHTLEAVPEMEYEIERIVRTNERSVMPLLWVRGEDGDRCEASFDEDPTIEDWNLLAAFDREWLYRMEWIDQVKLVTEMITNSEATILNAHGGKGRWMLRVMYPDRERLSEMHEFCSSHGLTFEVVSIRKMEGEPAGRYGLTTQQYEALTAAAERGLFDVPRKITLKELAEELDNSHQALSERIRRATGALVEDTLLMEASD